MIEETQFNRATLEYMTTLRRRLKQDTGVTIRLAEPDALRQLLEASQNSTEEAVRELGRQLAEATRPRPQPELEHGPAMGQGAIASRQYRARADRTAEPDPESTPPSASVRIYRGQVVRS